MRCLRWLTGLSFAVVLAWTGLVGAQAATFAYRVTALGEFLPSDVNRDGAVIGRVGGKPAMFKDGAIMPMQDLGYGGNPLHWSDATPGVSVGYVILTTEKGTLAAAQWDASGALTLLYTHDQSYGSEANAQNWQGQTSGFGGRLDHLYGGPVSSALRWDDPQSLTVLDTMDGSWSESIGIDGLGRVWGIDGAYNLVAWTRSGKKLVVPGNPGRWPTPVAVNAAGVVVGFVTRLDSFDTDPFVATLERGFTRLPSLAQSTCLPADINTFGVVIGNCQMDDGSASVPVQWVAGQIFRLPIELPEGVAYFAVRGMNDRGQLVAVAGIREPDPFYGTVVRSYGFLYTPKLDVAVTR